MGLVQWAAPFLREHELGVAEVVAVFLNEVWVGQRVGAVTTPLEGLLQQTTLHDLLVELLDERGYGR
eukprot:CAMPEP_0205932928 /NCGR_PEP_ID=MMETSP1325-20131115/31435_1 /ASSEMBLY_ACC=CAM_ASM_000708 /TAXON_ID=236786 /ORGANISM="Florenciella sp., Strain RCC1007" /LENGTH=66 /DNA_ID=CAMNT_0053302717 /DNA_START=14 /DNA_END=211 /DNA_ORIENTATION=+